MAFLHAPIFKQVSKAQLRDGLDSEVFKTMRLLETMGTFKV